MEPVRIKFVAGVFREKKFDDMFTFLLGKVTKDFEDPIQAESEAKNLVRSFNSLFGPKYICKYEVDSTYTETIITITMGRDADVQ